MEIGSVYLSCPELPPKASSSHCKSLGKRCRRPESTQEATTRWIGTDKSRVFTRECSAHLRLRRDSRAQSSLHLCLDCCSSSCLAFFHCSQNNIGPDGAAHLSTSLAGLTSMKDLYLRCGSTLARSEPLDAFFLDSAFIYTTTLTSPIRGCDRFSLERTAVQDICYALRAINAMTMYERLAKRMVFVCSCQSGVLLDGS
jgi:hypothetical protein